MTAALAGRVVADYEVLREAAGWVELPRDVLRVVGPSARSYLQGQCSQDVEALGVGDSCWSLVLSPQGKLEALVRVSRLAEEAFCVDTEAGWGTALEERLRRFLLRVAVEIVPEPWRCVAVRGPATADPGALGFPGPGVEVAAVVSWNTARGVDLLGAAPPPPPEVPRCSLEAWEIVRIEAGIPKMGAELGPRTIPAEADLVARTVDFEKGCYTGQELVARIDARGSHVARHLRGFVFDPSASTGLPPVGATVQLGSRAVGTLTSVAWSPSFAAPVALGYVHRDVEPPAVLEVLAGPLPEAPEGEVQGSGGERFSAEVRSLPLL